MKQFTATCDRFKATETGDYEGKLKLNLNDVGVGFKVYRGYSYDFVGKTQQWCDDCCIKLGLKNPPDKKEPVVSPPTIEDMIRELVLNEIQAQ
jgi:hypothetical protein